ncbi:MAG: CCA tRNA nucleotidyltransferase [Planctomycetes bacterium]|nr:CCA tRNA nucleotidyltransferase [Planctomycetota bacterium]
MGHLSAFPEALPDAAAPAIEIVHKLRGAGHEALLAGGCVRDLLLGCLPQDYDVATDAPPERVCRLFRATRRVGAQFGVVLVRKRRRWIEVATFRSDGPYRDGRRPERVTFCSAREDALRRDFTINGMFLDPLQHTVIDYVGGRADLTARLIRAIGEPGRRFGEDHLRLLRAVRFAARLGFAVEPDTRAAIRQRAARLRDVAPERVREELEKMLLPAGRSRALRLLAEFELLPHLWPRAAWTAEQITAAEALLGRLPAVAPFEAALAAVLAQREAEPVNDICRALTCSNEQRETVVWLVQHQADLDDAAAVRLSALKRLMAHGAFDALRVLTAARFQNVPDGARRAVALEQRLAAIAPEAIKPAPFVTGDDLLARGIEPGPIYKQALDEVYTRQLEETLDSRAAALHVLDEFLQNSAGGTGI